jgi:MFS family permease
MDHQKDLYFRRNVLAVSMVEFFWGLGFPIVLESTFLQLFLKHLGASSFAIGMVPSLLMTGIACFPVFSSYLSRNVRMKMPIVLFLHLISAFSILLFGVTLLFTKQSGNVLPLFFISYSVFSICMGLTIPVWLNYLVRIFSESKSVPGLGYMMLAQNIGKVIASFFILTIVEKYSFSTGSTPWVFIITGLVFVIGSLCFVFTREVADKDDGIGERISFLVHTRQSFTEIISNRRFLIFLAAADLEFIVIITSLSFYANYATIYFNVPVAVAAGLFVACIYTGSITVNIFLGALNFFSLKQKFVLSKFITVLMLSLLVFCPGYAVFFLVSYMLGFGRATRNMVYPPSVKKFAARSDATSYFALAPILTLPVTAGYPLLFGNMLDRLAGMGQMSYQILFGLSALIAAAAACLALITDYREVKVS